MAGAGEISDELWVCHLGTVPYREAIAIQHHLRARRQADELPDVLLLLEHPPVYTRGRRAAEGELTLGERYYRERGIDLVTTDRGGRVTYHGPGQLVGYAIMRVADLGAHLRRMEAAIVSSLAESGVRARSRREEGPDYTGAWVQERKIASIGVHVSRGVSTHGFAVNLDLDLEPFSWVVACGLPDVAMTSLAREVPAGRMPDPAVVRERAARHFCHAHGRSLRPVAPARLGIAEMLPLEPTGWTPRQDRPVGAGAGADGARERWVCDAASLLSASGARA